MKKLLICLICIFAISNVVAQKKFNVTIKWPAGLVTDKMQVFYNNGVKGTLIDPIPGKNEIKISDDFISKYVTINVIVDKNNYNMPLQNIFYIAEKPATITFNLHTDSSKHFETICKMSNTYDVNKIAKKYELYVAEEEKERKAHMDSNGPDSTYFLLYRKLILKKIEFIRQNRDSYFAFQVFYQDIATVQFPNQDSLVDSFPDFYKTTFPEDVRKSPEGMKVTKIMESRRIGSHDNVKAPEFTITDISGNKISLDNLKNKYILINFWATWCGPCVAELPAIRQIREKYPEDKLTIISVSFDKNLESLSEGIKKYKMDWINVYKDEEFASNYGGLQAIPKLFLIDKKGMIIYNRSTGKETDYVNLKVLNEVLGKEIGG